MKPFYFLLIASFFFSCSDKAIRVIEKYPNGQTRIEYVYPDKLDTSTYSYNVYYASGKLHHKMSVSSGYFVGEKITYHENGKTERTETLHQPVALDARQYDCRVVNYFSNGNKKSEYEYSHGQINGRATDYDSSGRIIRTADYKNGRMNGKEILYFPNGQQKSIAYVTNDTLSGYHIEFRKNGDTLKWYHNGAFGVNGVFYKKWLDNGHILTGEFGDSLLSFVIWKWYDHSNKFIRSELDRSQNERYIAPE